jgi:hypothetical protein
MTIADRQRAAMNFANAEYSLQLAYDEHQKAKTRFENAQAERNRLHALLVDVGCVGANVTSRLFRIDSTHNVLLEYNRKAAVSERNRVNARVLKTEAAA